MRRYTLTLRVGHYFGQGQFISLMLKILSYSQQIFVRNIKNFQGRPSSVVQMVKFQFFGMGIKIVSPLINIVPTTSRYNNFNYIFNSSSAIEFLLKNLNLYGILH
uniref:Uncharacterized protein n=1 Tax=Cacopsylla melanoneura TaxID=428564 RepID=A0A8D8ZD28_9HEMI